MLEQVLQQEYSDSRRDALSRLRTVGGKFREQMYGRIREVYQNEINLRKYILTFRYKFENLMYCLHVQ